MESPIISLEKVAKVYRMGEVEVPALRGVTLTVGEGDTLVTEVTATEGGRPTGGGPPIRRMF